MKRSTLTCRRERLLTDYREIAVIFPLSYTRAVGPVLILWPATLPDSKMPPIGAGGTGRGRSLSSGHRQLRQLVTFSPAQRSGKAGEMVKGLNCHGARPISSTSARPVRRAHCGRDDGEA